MNLSIFLPALQGCARAAALVGLAMLGLPAVAALDSPVVVRLIAPGGFTNGVDTDPTPFTDTDTVRTADGIVAGDASQIGSVSLLPPEFVSFAGNSIQLRVAAGALDAGGVFSSGFLGTATQHARFEFDNLRIAGQTIVGIDVFAFDGFETSGFSSVTGGVQASLLSPSRVSFDLDDLRFVERGDGRLEGYNYADFRIDLLTQAVTPPVPEPATWLLTLAALPVLRRAVRNRR